MHLRLTLVGALAIHAFSACAYAQFGATPGAQGGTNPNAQGGLQQTGQVQSGAAVQRNQTNFLNSTSGTSFLTPGNTSSGVPAGGQTDVFGGLPTGFGAGASFGAGFGGGFGGAGGFGRGGFGGGGTVAFGTQQPQTGAANQLRIPVRLGFTPQRVRTPNSISRGFAARLTRLPGLEKVAPGVVVTMDGQIAVLQGSVPNDHDRDLIATLALLEPGISDVRNELQVVPSPEVLPAQ